MTWLYGALAALGLLVLAAVVFIAITWAIYDARTKGARPLGAPKGPTPPATLDPSDRLVIRGQLERELGSLELVPSDVWKDAPMEDHGKPEASEDLLARWPEFMEEVRKRLEKGRLVYGDRSIRRPPAELRGEMAEELLDVLGWSYWLWLRVQDLEVGRLYRLKVGDEIGPTYSSARAKLLEAHPELNPTDSPVTPEGQEVRP